MGFCAAATWSKTPFNENLEKAVWTCNRQMRMMAEMSPKLYPHLLALHGMLRWVVLAAAVAAMIVALSGWSGKKPAGPALRRCGIFFVVCIDLEFLLGLILYFVASPLVRAAFHNMAAAMKNHELRFFAVEHTTYMLLAVVCAHLGAALSRKAKTDVVKYRGAAISYAFSLLLIVAGTPWWRPLLRLGS
jgi:hypothetical protein